MVMWTIRNLAFVVLTAAVFFPLPAAAGNVSVDLTEIVIDRHEPGADVALVGILPQLEKAFPEAAGFHMVAWQRVDVDEGSTRRVHFDDVAWELDYLGVRGEFHQLEISTPRSTQTVRVKPGATFFFATKGQDGVVALSIEPKGLTTPDAGIATQRSSLEDAAPSTPAHSAQPAYRWPAGWLMLGALGLIACALIVIVTRRPRIFRGKHQ